MNIRMYSVHTCDKRSDRSTLVHLYPHLTYTFEAPFPEHDPLWEADVRETNEHVVERALTILDKAFQRSDTCKYGEGTFDANSDTLL